MSRQQDNGVAPIWRDTGDGAYAIPAGYQCIGFYVGGAGNVSFTSGGVATGDIAFPQGLFAGKIDSFQAPSSGGATDIWALLLKG